MRLTILGGTGKIGRLVVEHALAAGHEVTVLARDPRRLAPAPRSGMRVVEGDVSDPDALGKAVDGANAVISALGPTGNSPDQVAKLREGMRNLIAAMGRHGVHRVVNLSGAAVDVRGERKPLFDRVASRIVRIFARYIVEAKQAEYEELASSNLDWVAVRPPLVNDGPRTGRYRAGIDILRPGARISRADIADFMLAEAIEPKFIRQAPFILY
jgi:putative NADH-flavin reductase